MTPVAKRSLKTGGDPRTLPDFASLRDEFNKLTHPARPDVDWRLVERRSLNLFDNNGIELQTAAWYTLARTHLNGITGLNEGLAIIDALITWQWASIWPGSAHARIEILSSLSKRLQQTFRMLPLRQVDQRECFNTEKLLSSIESSLQRLELRHASGLAPLRLMVQNAGIRLENSAPPLTEEVEFNKSTKNTRTHCEEGSPLREPDSRWVFVVNPQQPNIASDVRTASPKRLSPVLVFTGGFASAALLGLLAFSVIPKWLNHPEQKALLATVAPLPEVMSGSAIAQLRKADPDWLRTNNDYNELLNKQLELLGKLPPVWTLQYGSQLVEQTKAVFPGSVLASEAEKKWRSILTANALPYGNIKGWREGSQQLRQLQEKLNSLDEKKGRYMTVSELKTAVFNISKSFNSSVPIEELIRQLQNTEADQTVSPVLLTQIDSQLQQLINSYLLTKLSNNNQ